MSDNEDQRVEFSETSTEEELLFAIVARAVQKGEQWHAVLVITEPADKEANGRVVKRTSLDLGPCANQGEARARASRALKMKAFR